MQKFQAEGKKPWDHHPLADPVNRHCRVLLLLGGAATGEATHGAQGRGKQGAVGGGSWCRRRVIASSSVPPVLAVEINQLGGVGHLRALEGRTYGSPAQHVLAPEHERTQLRAQPRLGAVAKLSRLRVDRLQSRNWAGIRVGPESRRAGGWGYIVLVMVGGGVRHDCGWPSRYGRPPAQPMRRAPWRSFPCQRDVFSGLRRIYAALLKFLILFRRDDLRLVAVCLLVACTFLQMPVL